MKIEYSTIAVRIWDYCIEIKNVVVVVVLIFLKHNGLCRQVITSSHLWQVDNIVDIFHNSWCSQEVGLHMLVSLWNHVIIIYTKTSRPGQWYFSCLQSKMIERDQVYGWATKVASVKTSKYKNQHSAAG